MISPGEWAQPGAPLFMLVDDDPLKIELSVAEAMVPLIHDGQQIEVASVAYPGKTYGATVKRLSGEVSRQSRSLIAEAELAPQTELVPGMFAEVHVTVGQTPRPVIPLTAIKHRGASERVFVVVNGRAEERVIRTGVAPDAEHATVAAGLDGGELIVAK